MVHNLTLYIKLCHFYRIAQCSSKNSMTLSIIIIFHNFSMTFAIFHDFSGLENDLPKFHDFPRFSMTRGHPDKNFSVGMLVMLIQHELCMS